jgi:regulator of CtrA degradation
MMMSTMNLSDTQSTGSTADRARTVQDFARSELFDRTFREGMELVEETAAYLDGEGRRDSKMLSRAAALAYAAESMKLTTRLMQIASWLLVQRAVAEGEITPGQAQEEKRRVKLTASETRMVDEGDGFALLPAQLQDLVERSRRLHARILHLDTLIVEDRPTPRPIESPVAAQQGLLRSAFGGL